jgi:hypothetical protein
MELLVPHSSKGEKNRTDVRLGSTLRNLFVELEKELV